MNIELALLTMAFTPLRPLIFPGVAVRCGTVTSASTVTRLKARPLG
jgi:hypothetical protein